jgi:peptidoglycan/xylan/chitin deacetylase (PgdA/CDA1 family)
MTKHQINILLLFLSLGLIFLFLRNSIYFSWLLSIPIFFFVCFLFIGVTQLRANYFLKATNKVRAPYVLLSFDDGPDAHTTPIVLQTLRAHGVKAIFFVIGQKAEDNKSLLNQIVSDGHLIGNHTYTHLPLFAAQHYNKVTQEVSKTNQLLQNVMISPIKWFRPPVGYTNPIIARAIRTTDMTTIGWTLRSYDTLLKNPDKLKKRLLKHIRPGSIILLHDNLNQTAVMLDDFIQMAKKNGVIFANESSINTLLK